MSDPSPAQAMWDERYRAKDYVYGTEPNGFLRCHLDQIPAGDVLCLADGEGRNSVFLAERGWRVTAIDLSEVGVAKARALARERGVEVNFIVHDLRIFDLGIENYDAVTSIFAHMPPKIRTDLHARVVAALRPRGVFLLEAYRPEQISRGTGGPSLPEMMMTLEELRRDLSSLDLVWTSELERDIREGLGHQGVGSVVQVIGCKRGGAE